METGTNYSMVAKTFAGLEEVLAEELKGIKAKDVKILRRAVSFTGDKEVLYKANYLCRTAIRVLVLIDEFKIRNEEDLYNRIAKINWDNYMSFKKTFAIDANVFDSCINHTKYAALKVKDAIVDQYNRKYSLRPSVESKRPDIRLNLHIENNNCLLYLDSSGSSLHKRGYRIATNEAPINEILAAGLIHLSGWDGNQDFIDPMCGSGTILIEAAMKACNIPSGYYRKYYCFKKWRDFDEELWNKIIENASGEIIEPEGRIIGSDISEESIDIAKKNIRNAKLHYDIELEHSAIQDYTPPTDGGVVITNPPYDERIKIDDAKKLYQDIGDSFKNKFKNYNAWVITSNLDSLKFVGLKPSKKIKLYNGPLECCFAKYDVYEGSKKEKFNKDK